MSLISNRQFTFDTFQVAIPNFFEIEIFSDAIGAYIKLSVVCNVSAAILILITILKDYVLPGTLLQNFTEQKAFRSSDPFTFYVTDAM